MHPDIRKTFVITETTYSDGGKAAGTPLVMIAAVAVVKNPWPARATYRIWRQKSVKWRRC
ncbi:Protein of uncharacterised function (DUF1185) [Serratia odorifera]|uniref:Protein of uncharacterized function (DUF1185) n=1 Tax=Serratia odorifera TaxID=618 RepID=A0A3S4E5T7_SEROD|nr:Protein of uncharacterised function (DUF1185) [Serratia odorifera]